MAKGFGIAALVLAILSAFAAYGFNFFAIWLAMICAAIAALNGDRPFTIASTIIAFVGLILFSPVTMTVIVMNLKGGHDQAALLGFAPFVLPFAALVADVARKAETVRGRQIVLGAGIVGALLCAAVVYEWQKEPALTPEESVRQMVGLPNPATTASAQSASPAAPQVVQAPAPQVAQASSPPPMQTPTGTMVAHLGFESDYRDDSGMGNGASPRGGMSFVQGYAPSSGKAVRFDDAGSAIIVPSSNSLDIRDQFSVSLWFQPNAVQRVPYAVLFYKAAQDVNSPSVRFSDRAVSLSLFQDSVATSYTFDGDATQTNCSNPGFKLTHDAWHNVIFAFNSSAGSARTYVDGQLLSECTFPPGRLLREGNREIGIGAPINEQLSDSGNFNGAVDSVRLYHAALTDGQIAAIYNGRQ